MAAAIAITPTPHFLSLKPLSPPSPLFHHQRHHLRLSATTTTTPPLTNNTTTTTTQQLLTIPQRANLLRLSLRYTDPALAKAVHALTLKLDSNTETYITEFLISVYAKLDLVNYGHKVFDGLSSPSVVPYASLISGLANAGREDEAVTMFVKMRRDGVEGNGYAFVGVLSACMDLEVGLQVHGLAVKMGLVESVFVGNSLMGMYVKYGCLGDAVKVFEGMSERDVVSWNTVLSGLVREGMYERAIEMFCEMRRREGEGDCFTLSTVLGACGGSGDFMSGKQVHGYALKVGLSKELSVGNALIGFYVKCGEVEDVERLFEGMRTRDVYSWTGMVTAYMEFGLIESAVEIFDKMPQKNTVSYNALLAGFCKNNMGSEAVGRFVKMVEEGLELNEWTLTSVLNACGLLMDRKTSEQLHGFIVKFGFESNDCVDTALLDMCTRCGRMVDAEKMFQMWPSFEHNSLIWTSMICGYAREGQGEEAVSLFHRSQWEESMVADVIASTSVLGVCGTLGFRQVGEQIHSHAIKSGFLSDTGVGNAIISMYAKCWDMNSAIKAFNSMAKHDLISWNALIHCHILHRQGEEALAVWSKMENAGMKPDEVTLILIISAYRYHKEYMVDDCLKLFSSIETLYNIKPTSQHYASLVGVLGYWGLLKEAEEMIRKMPFPAPAYVWRVLLDSCRFHLDTTIGKRVTRKILEIEPQDPSTFILVSNIYSASGRWQCSEAVRQKMREKGLRKHPARSWIIQRSKLHTFYARDKSHPQVKEIYAGLDILVTECLKAGYVQDTSFVLHEVEEYQKEEFLFYHSAKLAVAYGILTTSQAKPVRVVKNVVLCGDCHAFMKYVSVVTSREILIRDASGFHHFVNGKCSCKDYW